MFIVGNRYDRQRDIHDKFGGNRQSGIAPCAKHPFIFLFASPRGDEYGYQDGWVSEVDYIYTGEGTEGDMDMVRGNRQIRDHMRNGKELLLFHRKTSSGPYEHLGKFIYNSHEKRVGIDLKNQKRSVIMFRLRRE